MRGLIGRACIAIAMLMISLWVLEPVRQGASISQLNVGQMQLPVSAIQERDGLVVFSAHGFVGSRQMVQGLAAWTGEITRL